MNKLPDKPAKNTGSSGGRRSVNIYGNVNLSSNDIAELRKLADSHPELAQQIATDRRVIAISDQIGMRMLSRVASDVTQAIDSTDVVAIAATLARLLRIGESSLTAIWDSQDLSL